MTTHRQEQSPRCSAHASADEKMHDPVVQVPGYLAVPKYEAGTNTRGAKNIDEEEDKGTAGFCAPIELLAEFLKAVMEKDYELAKNLCQMILIYEPENPEAKLFLPLIEERLIEEAQEGCNSEDNTSDDDDDDDEEDDDDDDDDDESNSGSCDDDEDDDVDEGNSGSGNDDDDEDDDDTETDDDSDGENICSSSSNREDENIIQGLRVSP